MIAASGEIGAAPGRTGLHCEPDFDVIADVTGQPMQWVVPCVP